jgi:hypothetical protein
MPGKVRDHGKNGAAPPAAQGYIRTPREAQDFVPDHAAGLLAAAGT